MEYLIISIALMLIGILIKHAKWHFLIAGYNTSSKEEKKSIDIEKGATLMRNTLFLMGAIILGGYYVSILAKNDVIATTCFFVSLVGGVLFLLLKNQSLIDKNQI